METLRKIGLLLIIIAIVIGAFGYWIKTYNDKIAQTQLNETGTCYLPDGTCIHATSDSILYTTTGIAIFLAVLGAYLFLVRKEVVIATKIDTLGLDEHAKKEDKKHEVPKTLGPDMKHIYSIITESNGAVLQGELVQKSGMDKVKVSRILDKLEMQGLVERRRHGMSNLVVLKK